MKSQKEVAAEIKELEKARAEELDKSKCMYFKFARNRAREKYYQLGIEIAEKRRILKSL